MNYYNVQYTDSTSEWISQVELDKWPELVDQYLREHNRQKNQDQHCGIVKAYYSKKRQTAGLLVFIYSCGIILNFEELIRAESNTIIIKFLKLTNNIISNNSNCTENKLKFGVYDNGCRLAASVSKNIYNSDISDMKFVIDRMHIKTHKKSTCKQLYSCDNFIELKNLNSEVCEQRFSLLLKHKTISKHMSRYHYEFYYLCLFDYYNKYGKQWFEKDLKIKKSKF